MITTAEGGEGDLIGAARAGSGDAFGELAERYRERLIRLAYRLTRDRDEAQDIAQESLVRAYRRLDSFRPEKPFSSWLSAIARNAALDVIRARRAIVLEPDPDRLSEPSSEELALRDETRSAVNLAITRLPDKYRRVLELHYGSDLLYREIAQVLGVPIGTVKTRLARGKARLREMLSAGGGHLQGAA